MGFMRVYHLTKRLYITGLKIIRDNTMSCVGWLVGVRKKCEVYDKVAEAEGIRITKHGLKTLERLFERRRCCMSEQSRN